jgi:hypothetical protein
MKQQGAERQEWVWRYMGSRRVKRSRQSRVGPKYGQTGSGRWPWCEWLRGRTIMGRFARRGCGQLNRQGGTCTRPRPSLEGSQVPRPDSWFYGHVLSAERESSEEQAETIRALGVVGLPRGCMDIRGVARAARLTFDLYDSAGRAAATAEISYL